MTGPVGELAMLDRLAAVSRWVDAVITARLEASQRARAAELARERQARRRVASRRAARARWRARVAVAFRGEAPEPRRGTR